jgi:predicted transcriptional regulator
MTENQKAVLILLKEKDMTLEDIAVELHLCVKNTAKVLNNMVKHKYIELDEDTFLYTPLVDYTPESQWSFKELLGAWKK